MSRFYANISGGRGQATRQGHAASGIRGHVRGWTIGVRVVGRAIESADTFDIYATGGSSSPFTDTLIGTIREGDDGRPLFEMYHGQSFPL